MSENAKNTGAHGQPMIVVNDVSRHFGATRALDGVSISVGTGEVFALLGPNGAGKTTLLSILCTIARPDGGTAQIAGTDVVRHPLRARRRIGVVFQEPSLDDRLSLFENLEFHGLAYGVPRHIRRERIDELLEVVDLMQWKNRLVRTLSTGMKRRLEIARALVHDARVLFLDEPTVGLDAQSRESVWAYLSELRRKRDLTIVVTTHYIEEVENVDRVCVIDHGKVLSIGTPAELKRSFGLELMRVKPKDAATHDEILATYAGNAAVRNDEIVISNATEALAERFLGRFGSRIRSMEIAHPSLESVFLSMTGRAVRDELATPQAQTLSFAKRGGEHTK